MNLVTVQHAAIIMNTDPYIVLRLMCKGIIESTTIGNLYQVNEVSNEKWDEYKLFAKDEEALS